MPSTPSPTERRTIPWFLDALRWTCRLCPAADRDTIELVRLDVADELGQLLAEGVPRRRAYGQVWRRMKVECGFFWPRAGAWWKARAKAGLGRARGVGRRMVKPAVGVGLVGVVLLSAKWLWFDRTALQDFADVRRQLVEATQQLGEAQTSLGQFARQDAVPDTNAEIPLPTQQVLRRIEQIRASFAQARRDYPGEFFLDGLIGLVDEDLAKFWESAGDSSKTERYWTSALQNYRQGAERGDPYALLHLGFLVLQPGRFAYRNWLLAAC